MRAQLRDRLPSHGFGGASVGNLYRASSDDEAAEAMRAAARLGFRYVDTAPYYGHGLSEVRIGRFLRETDGEIVLSTKVGRLLVPAGEDGPPDHGFADPLPFTPVFDYSYDGVMRSFEQSCARLGVERLDILYMHDLGEVTHGPERHPDLFRVAMDDGYRAMARLREQGLVQAIGLGVNEWQVCLQALAHVDVDVFMLAGRYTLLEQEPLDHLFPECVRRGVDVVVAGPLNSGLLARRPDENSRYNYGPAPQDMVGRAQRIFDVCAAHGVSAQAAALQFPLFHPAVVSVVSGMSSAARVAQTKAWADEPVPAAVWSALKTEGLLREDAPTERIAQ